jgi:hypothetical protein
MTFSSNTSEKIDAGLLIELVGILTDEVLKAPKSDKRDRLIDVLKLSKKVAEMQLKSSRTIEYLMMDRDRKELFMEMYQRDAEYKQTEYDILLKKYDKLKDDN